MESFAKLVNDWLLLTIFLKCSILDIWLGCEFASDSSKHALDTDMKDVRGRAKMVVF